MLRLLSILVLLVVMALIFGCSSPTTRVSAAELPDDFSLSVTVLPASKMDAAWYIVEPDGTLRAAIGERLPQSRRPPAVRTLTRPQVRQVWEVATKAGLTDHAALTERVSPASASATNGAAIVDVSAMGRRTSAVIGPDRVTGLRPVVDLLRELAWADK